MNLEQLKEVIVAALPNCNPDAVTLEAQIGAGRVRRQPGYRGTEHGDRR